MSFIITHSAYEVYRIEVRTLLEHFFLLRIVHVDLRAFEDLQGDGSVAVVSKERTAAGFAYVLHHSADTHRAVELVFEVNGQYGVFEVFCFRVLAEEFLLQELKHFHHLVVRILAAVEQREVFEYLFLQGHEHSGNQFLIRNGVGFQTVGHYVVDVLDEDDVCVQVVQVLNQRAMTTGTEQQFAVVAERLVVHIGSNGVGTWLLLGEGDVIVYAVTFGEVVHFFRHEFLEKFAVFGRHGEVYVHFAALAGCIQSAFGKMFLHRSAGAFGIFMEFEQTFR